MHFMHITVANVCTCTAVAVNYSLPMFTVLDNGGPLSPRKGKVGETVISTTVVCVIFVTG